MTRATFAPPAAAPAPSAKPAALALGRWALMQLIAAGILAALFSFIAGIPPQPEEAQPAAQAGAPQSPAGSGAPGLGPTGGNPAPGGGNGAPGFRLASLDGQTATLADFKGQVVVLDFWATWCGPCRQQAVILEDLHQSLGQKVVFLGINVGEKKETVANYVRRAPFPYRTLLDPTQQVAAQYGAEGLPTLVVIGPQGNVVFHNVGVTPASRLAQAIQKAAAG